MSEQGFLANRLELAFSALHDRSLMHGVETFRPAVHISQPQHLPPSQQGNQRPAEPRYRRGRRRQFCSTEATPDANRRKPQDPEIHKTSAVDILKYPGHVHAAGPHDQLQDGWVTDAFADIPKPRTDSLFPPSVKPAQRADNFALGFVVAKGSEPVLFSVREFNQPIAAKPIAIADEPGDALVLKKSKLDQRYDLPRPQTCGAVRSPSSSSTEMPAQQRLQRIGGSARVVTGGGGAGKPTIASSARCSSAVISRRQAVGAGSAVPAAKARPTTSFPLGRGLGVDGKVRNAVVKHELPSKMSGARRLEYVTELLSSQKGEADSIDPMAFYILGEELGKGAFGSVRAATHVVSGEKVAIKTYDKYKVVSLHKHQGQPLNPDICMHEVRLLERLSHPNVITLHQTISTAKKVHMVLDFVSAGDLAEYVKFRSRLPEPEARWLFKQVLAGLVHCHRNKVTHRDLKMENVMLLEDQTVKIIDFGMGEFTDSGRKLRLQCGTPAYAAPEIWADKSYSGPQADVWSLGVMLYIMLVGKVPFHHPNAGKMFELVTAAKFSLPSFLSSAACSFIRSMLTADPKHRATLKSLVAHSWLSDEDGVLDDDEEEEADLATDGDDAKRVVAEMLRLGFNVAKLGDDLGSRKRSNTTVCYKLLLRAERARRRADRMHIA